MLREKVKTAAHRIDNQWSGRCVFLAFCRKVAIVPGFSEELAKRKGAGQKQRSQKPRYWKDEIKLMISQRLGPEIFAHLYTT